MGKIKIIGLVGFKGSGKSTLAAGAKMWWSTAKVGVNHIGFADPMYEMMKPLGFTVAEVTNPALRDVPQDRLNGKTIRYALQTIGTEWGRDYISPTLWTDIAIGRCVEDKLNIIDNIRFDEEFDAIRKHGGAIIFIDRPSAAHNDRHSSETNIERLSKLADGYVLNDTTIENGVDALTREIQRCLSVKNRG